MSGIGVAKPSGRVSAALFAHGSEGKLRDREGGRAAVCSSCSIALVHVGMKFLGAFVQDHYRDRLRLVA